MRIEHIGDATLYLGDCLEILPTLGKVDAVVTDPPYGIGFVYDGYKDDPEKYIDLMQFVVRECDKLVSEGVFFFWQALLTADKWHLYFPAGFRILASCKNFTQFRPISIQYGFDPVIHWRKGSDHKGRAGVRDWHIANTAAWVTGEKWGHPCPRPIDAVEWIIDIGTSEGTLILDPFMGSGTTGVACANLGRKFIGIEIEPKYFDIACRRIADAYKQPRLFEDEKPQPMAQELPL